MVWFVRPETGGPHFRQLDVYKRQAYNSAATSYDICAALTYDEPASGVEDLQVSTDHGSTWASVSDALGKKHVINTETNADYQFRLVTNAGNVSAATAAQNVVINRKMPGAPAIEVKDQNGNILNAVSYTHLDVYKRQEKRSRRSRARRRKRLV